MRRRIHALLLAAACMAACAQSPAHEALQREIDALRKKPAVCELPPYLPAEADFDAVCRKAGAEKKRVFVSIGREACGRCQRFYELVRRGAVRIDTNAFTFVRLNIDDHAQREYFLGTFEPTDNRLPFVGVTDGERSEIRPCLTGAPSAAEYQKLLEAK
ncbi:MAG: hypothetical protein ACI4RA_05470 [Kiritimatiellia bacterium]